MQELVNNKPEQVDQFIKDKNLSMFLRDWMAMEPRRKEIAIINMGSRRVKDTTKTHESINLGS